MSTEMRIPAQQPVFTAPVRLRPHHLLCLQNFRGKGYSPAFVRKITEIHELLLHPAPTRQSSKPPVTIQLVEGADTLCNSCPHCADGQCTSSGPSHFDALVLKQTGMSFGQILPLGIHSPKIPQVSEALLDRCCPGCTWLHFCKKICAQDSLAFRSEVPR